VVLLALSSWALAGPAPLVAVGDGFVGADEATVGRWSTVLADCLQEGAPGRWTVLDRTKANAKPDALLAQAEEVQALEPAYVVISLGPASFSEDPLDVGALREQVSGLVKALQGPSLPRVLLIGVRPSSLREAALSTAAVDATARFDAMLHDLAETSPDVHHLPLASAWPTDAAERAALVTEQGSLTSQGHARLAAAACDAVLSWAQVR